MKSKRKYHYTKQDILEASRVGLEIEFYSMLKSTQITRMLSDELGVKIVIPMDVDEFNKKKLSYHSEIVPTANMFKLEIDNSGGANMKELVTGPLSYADARKTIIKVFNWIKKNGWTTEKTSIHLNISFDNWKIHMPIGISHINKLKLALDVDENFIYKRFPEREGNVYARSVKDIFLNNIFYYVRNNNSLSITQFKTPTEKYYGINFLKIDENYSEFRYLGGEKYEEKLTEVFECLDNFVLLMYDNIIDTSLSTSHVKTLKSITINHKNILDAYKDFKVFVMNFPGVEIYSDMQFHEEIMKTQWHNFRDKLFELIILGKLRKGVFNFDSDMNAAQLKDGKIDGVELNGFEFLNCEISGHLENCDFYSCNVHNAIVKKGVFNTENKIEESKIVESMLFKNNTVTDSYIDNKEYVINCDVISSIIRSGKKGKNLKIDKDTVIVELKED